MEVTVIDHKGKEIKKAELNAAIFGVPVRTTFLHEVITAYLASIRAGTAATKTRSEVHGGGKKPWRQKGTGRARAGSIRSPLWRKGGVIFGPHPKSYKVPMSKKKIRQAICQSLSDKVNTKDLMLVDFSDMFSGDEKPKTKKVVKSFQDIGIQGKKILYVVDKREEKFCRFSRNIGKCSIVEARNLHAYAVLNSDKVLCTEAGIKILEERISA